MVRRILIIADRHHRAGEEPNPAYKLVKKFAKHYEPDITVDLGDLLDLPYISTFNESNLRVLSGNSFRADFDLAKRELDFWQKVSGEYILIEGNHDERIGRFIERKPVFEGFLEYENSLELKSRGVKFYHLVDKPLKIGKLTFIHGYWYNKYCANKHLEEYAHNVVFGHVHRFQTMSRVLPMHGYAIQAWAIGCLTDTQPDWMKGRPSGHQKGFAIVEMNPKTGFFNLYPIQMIADKFMYNGKIWS